MGCYINPHGVSKEQWLRENGEVTKGPTPVTAEHVPVCLVDNGIFTAAGVGYDEREADAFNQPTDYRPKVWYKVSREKVRTVSDLFRYEKQ